MSSDDTKFSHITVTSDDADDMVIHAGRRGADANGAKAVREAAGAEDAAAAGGGSSEEAAGEAPEETADMPARGAAPEKAPTSLEDLKGSPMSAMQKAIIVIALLAVAAFAVYYGFLR